jgi:hypothetical protein
MDLRSFARDGKSSRGIGRALLVLATAMFAAGACQKSGPDAWALATEIKAKIKVPVDVDSDTRLDDVRGLSKSELGYFLTLTKANRATLDPNFGKLLAANLRSSGCQNPAYITILKAGITITLVYRTADQVEVVRVVIAPKDCGL